jgi:hypothetical protein
MTTSGLTTGDLAGRGDAATQSDAPATPYPDEPTADGGRAGAPDAPDATRTAQPERTEPVDVPLLDEATADPFARRWSEVQARFVDDPRQAVRDADGLVAELMQALAERFAQHKGGLEEQWTSGSEPDTESLRLALQQYRSFFDRLLRT